MHDRRRCLNVSYQHRYPHKTFQPPFLQVGYYNIKTERKEWGKEAGRNRPDDSGKSDCPPTRRSRAVLPRKPPLRRCRPASRVRRPCTRRQLWICRRRSGRWRTPIHHTESLVSELKSPPLARIHIDRTEEHEKKRTEAPHASLINAPSRPVPGRPQSP